MKYIFISYNGDSFPIAKHLKDEGNEVLVSLIDDPSILGDASWASEKEDKERKRRRLSVYDGILEKIPIESMIRKMNKIKSKDEWFVFFDFNNLHMLGEMALKMGFTKGLLPTRADFKREEDRQAAKELVKEKFPGIKVAPVHEFSKVDDAIEFLNENEGIYALKSVGNHASTTVPQTDNEEFAREELTACLQKDQKEWEMGMFTLEQKIPDAIEVAPQIAFWDGEPIYTQVEFETRLIGSGEIGLQTGGIENLIVATNPSSRINSIAFPPYVYELAKKRKGLFLFDVGILFDPRTGDAFFTEFCGNRFGWGGVFSEISMCRTEDKPVSNYFEQVSQGKNPQTYRMGSNVALYNLSPDKDYPSMYKEGIAYRYPPDIGRNLNLIQVKKDGDTLVNTAHNDTFMNLLGYYVGYGNSMVSAATRAYGFVDQLAFNGLYYRPQSDYLSRDYIASIPSRFQYLIDQGWIEDEDGGA